MMFGYKEKPNSRREREGNLDRAQGRFQPDAGGPVEIADNKI